MVEAGLGLSAGSCLASGLKKLTMPNRLRYMCAQAVQTLRLSEGQALASLVC